MTLASTTTVELPVRADEARSDESAKRGIIGCPDLLGVGSTVWIFDENRRVYPKAEKGRLWASGGPIYREHWTPAKIISETSRSWITDRWDRKVPKKGDHPGVCFTQKEVDDAVWMNDHKYKVAKAVERCRDVEAMKAIARIVGYETPNAD